MTQRATVFGDDAAEYDATRPTYPAAAIDALVAHGPRTALEAGSGTGIATRLVRARGVHVTGVEPDPRMAELAATVASAAGDTDTTHVISRFEDVELPPPGTPVDLVFSAQAWHWVEPAAGAAKAAHVLAPGGQWAAMWNMEAPSATVDTLLAVYARHAPAFADEWHEQDAADDWELVHSIAEHPAFGPVARQEISWTERLTADLLVRRYATHSNHRLLPRPEADALHAEMVAALGGPEAVVTSSLVTAVFVAARRPVAAAATTTTDG